MFSPDDDMFAPKWVYIAFFVAMAGVLVGDNLGPHWLLEVSVGVIVTVAWIWIAYTFWRWHITGLGPNETSLTPLPRSRPPRRKRRKR